jgi:hypothetical protein
MVEKPAEVDADHVGQSTATGWSDGSRLEKQIDGRAGSNPELIMPWRLTAASASNGVKSTSSPVR